MDSLFAIIVLLCIFGFMEKAKRKTRDDSGRTAGRRMPSRPAAAPKKPAAPVRQPAASTVIAKDALQDAIAAFAKSFEDEIPEMPKARVLPTEISQGESFQDDEGCVGGSMPGHSEEGETHREHSEHLRKIAAEREAEDANRLRASQLRSVQLVQLRQAVVMSEILDKPVSLRRRSR